MDALPQAPGTMQAQYRHASLTTTARPARAAIKSERDVMTKRVWITGRCLAPKLPLHIAILWWLFLDRIGAPSWAYGVLWTIAALLAVVFVYDFWTSEGEDVPGFGPKS